MEVYHSAWKMIDAVKENLRVGLNANDRYNVEEFEFGFASKSRYGVLKGVIAALERC